MMDLILLGASGSIGSQTLEIIEEEQDNFRLVAFSVGNRVDKINEILDKHPSVKAISVKEKVKCLELKKKYPHIEVYYGDEGLLRLIETVKANMVVNALVGFVGLASTVHALKKGMEVALANKEAIVVGGELIEDLLKKKGGKIYPIDSEHVALSKCFGNDCSIVKEAYITASGGPFLGKSEKETENVTVEEALAHPNWKMGAKITIDSATMMNKGFEVIEASYLFNLPSEKIKIVIHPESKVHAAVRFIDEAFIFDLGPADMKVPISYALHRANRVNVKTDALSFKDIPALHFIPFEIEKYPLVGLAYDALGRKKYAPTILNAANEIAVYAFLNKKIGFNDITRVVTHIYNEFVDTLDLGKISLNKLIEADKLIREKTAKFIEGGKV